MTLGELLNGLDVVQRTPATNDPHEPAVSSLEYDSRRAGPGCVFFALPGHQTDGNRFARQAAKRGAVAVISGQMRPADISGNVSWVQVRDARKALALGAANFYGQPARALELIGVTGTNGKTTTSFLIDSILREAGRRTGLFGTVLYRTPGGAEPAPRTTPESLDLIGRLAQLRKEGGSSAVIEVSSHGLAMNRVWGLRFAAAVFTNFTRDHLDFHRTMENYFAAKRLLFEGTGAGAPANGIVNIDDPRGRELTGLAARTLTYGLASGADVFAVSCQTSAGGVELTANTPGGPIELRSRLAGQIQVANILAATATAVALGIDSEAIAQGIARLESVPGRFERVEMGQPFLVAVDYAHTDDALGRLVETARELKSGGRVLLLFGAGGNRDRAKRPLMGEAAGRGADLVVVTSDNPRGEDPQAIIEEILPGLERSRARYWVELDRARAIQNILTEARPGDIVLLAGKGHETYQDFGDRTIPFDDRLIAREVLRSLGYDSGRATPPGGPSE
ncbi:MAG TPA: UDP-N-acetylmuramoyl-L-alanyl-D-glutamate--2,6-diaminopimelate ligase [Patescibacteria group bacterium]|nr:UDP-N-acetylmuramoyl-L-alanyl-D-glutamate--2,6-diaminopimelate ligase [Patescibacteria group bacterium]